MYIYHHEIGIATKNMRKHGDPQVSITHRNGLTAYVLTATMDEPTEVVGTMYIDGTCQVWISLDTITPDDVTGARRATDAAWQQAYA